MRIQIQVALLVGACGHAPRGAATSTCVPADADVGPSRMTLTGATLRFCLGTPSCFMADLDAKTIVPASPPSDDAGGHKDFFLWGGNGANPASASLEPSARGVTVCTHDRATCHELPIAAASLGEKPVAVSDDATLVAIDTRSHGSERMQSSPGTLETWDAVTGKKLATFEMHYGSTTSGYESPNHQLEFLGHAVLAYTESACALPCSSATMYSVRGTYLGMLASDPTSATAERFHDELYLLRSPGPDWPFVVQDAATGKSVQLDPDRNASWGAVVTPDHIVRVVAGTPRVPRVEVWGRDLTLVTAIAVPACARP